MWGTIKLAGSAAAAPLAVGLVVSEEHVQLIMILAATLDAFAGLFAWIDRRIAQQIRSHSLQDVARHEAVLRELNLVRDLIVLREGPKQITKGE